jgi:hypothetical protein
MTVLIQADREQYRGCWVDVLYTAARIQAKAGLPTRLKHPTHGTVRSLQERAPGSYCSCYIGLLGLGEKERGQKQKGSGCVCSLFKEWRENAEIRPVYGP